jgi:nicotinamide-nucleotide amidase
VCFSVAARSGDRITRSVRLPGDRSDIRDRSTTVAMHLLRRLLRGEATAPLPGPGADSVSAAARL